MTRVSIQTLMTFLVLVWLLWRLPGLEPASGITGQGGAACQGIARALKTMFGLSAAGPEASDSVNAMAKKLRDSGYLTRDSRMKERKKYGQRGARRRFQFSKR